MTDSCPYDVHTMTASRIFRISPLAVTSEQRRLAKLATHPLCFREDKPRKTCPSCGQEVK